MKKNGIALAIILIILVLTLVACGDTTDSTDQSGNGDFVVTECVHNVVIDPAVPATCTKTGLTEGEHCSKCGEVLLAQTEVSATGHSPAKAVQENVVEATCTSTGSYDSVVYCDTCGEELSREKESIDVLDHNIVKHSAQEPTCTEVGWEAYETCSRCDYTTYTEIPATGHSPLDAVKENEITPDCKREGSYDSVVYCDTCGNELSREMIPVDALGHNIIPHDGKEPTCTEIGWYAYETCSRCDYTTYTEIPVTDHTYSSDCDISCNVCPYERVTWASHSYDNSCDTTCNYCGAVRTIEHTYSSDCDIICNVCSYERVSSASHSYDNS